MHRRKLTVLCLGVFLLLNTGCAMKTYSHLEPINPSIPYMCSRIQDSTVVESTKPKFIWGKSDEAGVTYDFAIFNPPKVSSHSFKLLNQQTTNYSYGEPIYYREALPTNEHIVQEDLTPDKYYRWSVRTRVNGRISPWSTFNCYVYVGFASGSMHNHYFPFKTSAINQKSAE